jgi:hypothetical protein
MEDKDLYWLAGWLEGEGSFLHGAPSRPTLCGIHGSSTDEDVVIRLSQLLGVKYHKQQKRKSDKPHYKDVFTIRITGHLAKDLMLKLKPLMGNRRQQQIDAAVNSYVVTKTMMTKDKLDKIKQLLGEGLSLRKIASLVDVDKSTVCNIKTGKAKHKIVRSL